MRGLREETQRDYIRFARSFAASVGRPPDTATAEDVRRFQVHQAESGVQAPTINCTVSALRFLFTVTLDRPDLSRRFVLVCNRGQPAWIPRIETSSFSLRSSDRPRISKSWPLIALIGSSPLRPVPANEVVLESGRRAGKPFSSTMGGAASFLPGEAVDAVVSCAERGRLEHSAGGRKAAAPPVRLSENYRQSRLLQKSVSGFPSRRAARPRRRSRNRRTRRRCSR